MGGPRRAAGPRPARPRRAARLYLPSCDEAKSGSGGHDQTLKVADKVAVGFGLSDDEALDALWEEWNPRCRPPWTRKELAHKVAEARKTSARRPASPPPTLGLLPGLR